MPGSQSTSPHGVRPSRSSLRRCSRVLPRRSSARPRRRRSVIIGAVPKSPTPDDELRAARVDGSLPPTEPVILVEYDPEWPRLYTREEARIREALGEHVRQVEHAGSTAI